MASTSVPSVYFNTYDYGKTVVHDRIAEMLKNYYTVQHVNNSYGKVMLEDDMKKWKLDMFDQIEAEMKIIHTKTSFTRDDRY